MNLSISNSLASNMMIMDRIIEAGNLSSQDIAINIRDLIEQAHDIKMVGGDLLLLVDDLSHAHGVLRDNGYSQELLDTLNADGKFLDAVNLDLVKLVGDDATKLDACMEGLWDAIKSAVAKVWEWIMTAVKTVVTWIRRLWAANKNEEGQIERLLHIMKSVEADKIREYMDAIGSAINSLGMGNKMYDLRELASRVSADCAIVRFCLVHLFAKMYNVRGADFEPWVKVRAEELAKNPSTAEKKNPLTEEIFRTLNTDPVKFYATPKANLFTGFNGFNPVTQPNTIKESMKRHGITIEPDGDDYSLEAAPIDECISRIDYAATYTDPSHYNLVLSGIKEIFTAANSTDRIWEEGTRDGGMSVKATIEKLKRLAEDKMKAFAPVKGNKYGDDKVYVANRYMSVWTGRLIMLLTRAQLDSTTCRQRISAITKAITAADAEFSKKNK